MTPPRSSATFAIVFAVVYAVAYVVAYTKNYALVTYHPAIGEFGAWVQKARSGPAMYWYGWIATAGAVATVAGIIACWLPDSVQSKLWSGSSWLVPTGAMIASVYFLSGFFMK